jgi:hypothetical protein
MGALLKPKLPRYPHEVNQESSDEDDFKRKKIFQEHDPSSLGEPF